MAKRFVVEYRHFSHGVQKIQVEAANKGQALVVAKKQVETLPEFHTGNICRDKFKVVRKLQAK